MADDFGTGATGMNPLTGMLDSMDMLKRAWSSFQLPAAFAPTMDVDELDRRIKDLRTVEQWLSMNLTMLQGSIQALEVQRNTLATLQAFSETMKVEPSRDTPATRTAPPERPHSEAPPPRTEAEEPVLPAAPDAFAEAAAAMNPTAWWELLRGQFEQVANSALRSASAAAGGGTAHEAPPRARNTSASDTGAGRKRKAPGAGAQRRRNAKP